MLILTRKHGESIRVGDGIIFTILEGAGGQVKIGITAPAHVSIHREEVYLRIRAENQAAARAGGASNLLVKNAAAELKKLGQGKAGGKKAG